MRYAIGRNLRTYMRANERLQTTCTERNHFSSNWLKQPYCMRDGLTRLDSNRICWASQGIHDYRSLRRHRVIGKLEGESNSFTQSPAWVFGKSFLSESRATDQMFNFITAKTLEWITKHARTLWNLYVRIHVKVRSEYISSNAMVLHRSNIFYDSPYVYNYV